MFSLNLLNAVTTSMHSSRMHTAYLLTISKHALHGGGGSVYPSVHWPGGCIPACTGRGCVSQHTLGRGMSAWGSLPRGVSAQGSGMSVQWGCMPRGWCVCPGGCLPRGSIWPRGVSGRGLADTPTAPTVNRMTDRCKLGLRIKLQWWIQDLQDGRRQPNILANLPINYMKM